MSVDTNEVTITAQVAENAMSATLRIPATADPSLVTVGACKVSLQQAGIKLFKHFEKLIKQAVLRYTEEQGANGDVEVVFEGTPSRPGKDGYIEWAEGCDPEQARDVDEQQVVDFYNQTHFAVVKAGQPIARIVPPTDGEVGYDVRGNNLEPKAGVPVTVKVNTNSVLVDQRGNCTAQIDGVLHNTAGEISVNPVLHLNDYVDFSTGNIRFSGDVIVHKGVRDRFSVEARGDVETGDLIEAAKITTGGDLRATGGIAAKNAGRLSIGRDLVAKYLEGAAGNVTRDARIEREVIQCRLNVGRELQVDNGALIGGVTTVTSSARLAELGSAGEQKTMLILGCHRAMELMIQRTTEHIEAIDQKIKDSKAELQALQRMDKPTAADREKMTELMCLPLELGDNKDKITQKRRALQERFEALRRVDLTVTQMIHPKVSIVVDHQQVDFIEAVPGPIWIGLSQKKTLVARIGGDDCPARPVRDLPGVALRRHTPPQALSSSPQAGR